MTMTELNDDQTQGQGHSGTSTALKAAAAAAATGAAAFAARKALSSDGKDDGERSRELEARRDEGSKGDSVLGSIFTGSWDAARDALVPIAEDAASAAGKYLAESGPDILRDRIVPRFIASFNEAQQG
jgi:hypothetical protein